MTCKSCELVFSNDDDKLIECGRCEEWECITCSSMTEAQYDVLNDVNLGAKLHYFCTKCNGQAIAAVKTDKDIEDKCKQYFQQVRAEIEEVRSTLDTRITSEVGLLREEITGLRNDMEENSDEKLRSDVTGLQKEMLEHEQRVGDKVEQKLHEATATCMEEFKNREERKHNIVVFNIPESDKVEGEEKKKDDIEALRVLMSKLDLTIPLSNVVRIGSEDKIGDRPRPIKAKTASTSDHRYLLKAAPKLQRVEGCKDVFIKRDETPLGRAQVLKLKDLRKAKMEESRRIGDNTYWVIKGGKVVKGRPRKEEEGEGGG